MKLQSCKCLDWGHKMRNLFLKITEKGLLFRDVDMVKQNRVVGRALTAEQYWLSPLDCAAALGTEEF